MLKKDIVINTKEFEFVHENSNGLRECTLNAYLATTIHFYVMSSL